MAFLSAHDEAVWSLFEDWCTATDRNPLPPEDGVLDAFQASLPAAESTLTSRRGALRRAYALFGYPDVDPQHEQPTEPPLWRTGAAWADLPSALTLIPRAGWPYGLRGRRDAWLLTLAHLGFTRQQIRDITPDEIDWAAPGRIIVAGREARTAKQASMCPACALAGWLHLVELHDRRGRPSVREALILQRGVQTGHACQDLTRTGWQQVHWTLLPAVDQHGWLTNWRPMSSRAISAVLAYRQSAPSLMLAADPYGEPMGGAGEDLPEAVPQPRERPEMGAIDEDLLSRVDDELDAADEVLRRILAAAEAIESGTLPDGVASY